MMKALQKWIDDKNRWQAIFDIAPVVFPKTTEQCIAIFESLEGELSPENLHCDGEITVAAARRKEKILRKVWAEVEYVYGGPRAEYEGFTV